MLSAGVMIIDRLLDERELVEVSSSLVAVEGDTITLLVVSTVGVGNCSVK